jgi:hypothetical protein
MDPNQNTGLNKAAPKVPNLRFFMKSYPEKNSVSPDMAEILKYKGGFSWIFFFFMYDIQHCFICRPSDSTVSEDAGTVG